MKTLHLRLVTKVALVFALTLAGLFLISFFTGRVATATPQAVLTISGQVTEFNGTPVPGVTMFITLTRDGVSETVTRTTDASGNYLYEDSGCVSTAKVEPSKAGLDVHVLNT